MWKKTFDLEEDLIYTKITLTLITLLVSINIFVSNNVFKLSAKNWTIWNFSEEFSKLMYQKLWLSFYEKCSKAIFFKILKQWSFNKNFRKSIFSSVKETPSTATIFSKCFFFAESRIFKAEILFFVKVFKISSNFSLRSLNFQIQE